VAQAHLSTRIPALAEARPSLHVPSLERLLQRATARRPEQRFPDAAALGQALDDLHRAITRDTRQLEAPPVKPPTLRERINRTAEELIAPRPPVTAPGPAVGGRRGATAVDGGNPRRAARPARAPARPRRSRRPAVNGIVVMLTLLIVVACGAYYGASLALGALADIQLPRPQIDVPSLPDLGFSLPEWLTGIVSGGGQTLVVTGVPDEGLNLRSAPGLKTQVIGLLPNGARVRRLEGPRSVDGVPWLRVRAKLPDGEREGWVSALFVKPE
jgi:hypothetical protein